MLILLLGACGDNTNQGATVDQAGEAGADATPVVLGETDEATDETEDDAITEGEGEAEEAVLAEAEGAVTDTVDAEGTAAGDVTVITDTELITGTEVTTDVTVTTDTVVLEQQQITTVITATDVVTDVTADTETETTTESEVITDTASLTTETDTGAAAVDVEVTPIAPTPTPTVVVELTRVVTDTEVVTETVEITAVATPAAGATPVPDTATGTTGTWIGIEGATENLIRASWLLDYDFENIDGGVSGEIEDLLIDTATGRILFATLEYGGFLDIGDTELPVPLSAFTWGPEGNLVLNIGEEQLQQFPDLGDDWPDLTNPAWDDEINNFWSGAGIQPDQDIAEASTTIRRLSELINYPVADMGFGMGAVQDMLIALNEGRVKYLLLTHPEGAALNNEWLVVPFGAFDAANLGTEFNYASGIDQSMLEQAPRLTEDQFDETGAIGTDLDDDWDTFWGDAGFLDMTNDGE
jgi:sporulation protein YlmC with PRC-barrel domain